LNQKKTFSFEEFGFNVVKIVGIGVSIGAGGNKLVDIASLKFN